MNVMLNQKDLQELIDRDILNEEELYIRLDMERKKELLAQHKYPIWQSTSDGRWYTYLPDDYRKNHRVMKKRTRRKDLENDIINFYSKYIFKPTVNDMFRIWLEGKRNNIKSQTAIRYENDFKKYIEPTWFGKMEIRDVSFKHLKKFCSETIGNDKMKAKCWSGIRTDLLGIIKTAKEEGLTTLSSSDMKDLDISKKAFKTERILPGSDVITNKEEKLLLTYISEHSDDIELLGIELLFKTGLRIGELSSLKYSDFDFEKGLLLVTRTEERVENTDPDIKAKSVIQVRENTKGSDGWRQIIIGKSTMELVEKIRELNPDGEWLFESKGKRIHSNAWTKRLPRLCAKLGIGTRSTQIINGETAERNYSLKKSPHKIRKNYASNLLHARIEPKFVQTQMGHADIQTTLKYYDRETEEFEEKKAALLPVLDNIGTL